MSRVFPALVAICTMAACLHSILPAQALDWPPANGGCSCCGAMDPVFVQPDLRQPDKVLEIRKQLSKRTRARADKQEVILVISGNEPAQRVQPE